MFDQPELTVATSAAIQAADVLMGYFRKENRIEYKSSFNLVSEADVQSEQSIVDSIRAKFPGHEILGEENACAEMESEHVWIVDPLDGTNNFCHGLEHFAISIAYYRAGEPNLAVIYRPCSGDMYVAGRNQGAFHNERPCQVANHQRLDQALIGVGFYYDRGQQMRKTLQAIESLFDQNIHGIRRMGTASLDLCMVGTGSFGGYFEFELAPWDYAAGKLFAEEAGGIVTDGSGNNFTTGNSSIVAACKKLHPALLELTRPHFESSRNRE